MRPIDADEFEKVIEAWIRMHWSEAFTGDDVGSDFLAMLDGEPTLEQIAKIKYCPFCGQKLEEPKEG